MAFPIPGGNPAAAVQKVLSAPKKGKKKSKYRAMAEKMRGAPAK